MLALSRSVSMRVRDREPRPDEILIVGRLPGPVRYATGRTENSVSMWDRLPYETPRMFRWRVRREAARAGVLALVFGGLPG